jgi:hypothetical protein
MYCIVVEPSDLISNLVALHCEKMTVATKDSINHHLAPQNEHAGVDVASLIIIDELSD